MIEIAPELKIGDLISPFIAVALVTAPAIYGVWKGTIVFRARSKLERERHQEVHAEIDERINKLAKGAVDLQDELHEFRREADRMYVRHDDFQQAVSVLSADVQLVIGTMGDVRDTVLRLESRLYPDEKPTLSPQRRRATKREAS